MINMKERNDNLNTISHICNSNEYIEAGDFPLDFYNEDEQKYINMPL